MVKKTRKRGRRTQNNTELHDYSYVIYKINQLVGLVQGVSMLICREKTTRFVGLLCLSKNQRPLHARLSGHGVSEVLLVLVTEVQSKLLLLSARVDHEPLDGEEDDRTKSNTDAGFSNEDFSEGNVSEHNRGLIHTKNYLPHSQHTGDIYERQDVSKYKE